MWLRKTRSMYHVNNFMQVRKVNTMYLTELNFDDKDL